MFLRTDGAPFPCLYWTPKPDAAATQNQGGAIFCVFWWYNSGL